MKNNSKSKTADYVFKVVIIGETGVGKTSLILRYVDQSFTENDVHPRWADFKFKKINLLGKTVTLQILELVGLESFRSLVMATYRRAHGFCIVYDITDKKSFEMIGQWSRSISELGKPNAKKLLIGSKVDLESERQVSLDDIQYSADNLKIPFVEVSSKSGYNVEETFIKMAMMLMEDVDGLLGNDGETINLDGNTNCLWDKHTNMKCC